jgi:hypothetical protein
VIDPPSKSDSICRMTDPVSARVMPMGSARAILVYAQSLNRYCPEAVHLIPDWLFC